MTTTLSKRNQARNEKSLQELIRSVPGNDRCADCGARNPGWASWNLGIFLCMRCASLHRKLGTHISKVKSLSMDTWSNEQVDGMKRNGNVASNRTYNPQNKKPQIPLDVDEVDSALERFIRQKYDQQSFSSNAPRLAVRHDTGSTRSSDDQPPPLPPKPGKRFAFGLRSVSSVLPSSRSNRTTPATSPDGSTGFGAPPSPIRVNKQSRVFGASVGGTNGEDMDAKLGTLRDMGFPDDRKNASILKGLGGNLERTIEALVRLGEGSAPSSRSRTPAQPRIVAVSQPLPSLPDTQAPARTNGAHPASSGSAFASQAGYPAPSGNQGPSISQEKSDRSFSPAPSQASDMSFHSTNPFQPRAYNPFESTHGPQPANYPPEKAFENIFLSQPLFPNATGGYPQPQPHVQDPRIQHSMTPPAPQILQPHLQSNQYAQQAQPPMGNFNPFIQASQLNPSTLTNPYAAPVQLRNIDSSFNPFMNFQETVIQSPISEHPHPSIYQQQVPQSFFQQHQQPQQPPQSLAPQQPNASITQQPQIYPGSSDYQQPEQQYTQLSPAPLQPQPTGRFDKSSIMALYNYPQFAPPALKNINEDGVIQSSPSNEAQGPQYPAEVQPRQPQRSVTMPAQMASGSRNPFQSAVSADPGTSMAPAIAINGSGSSRHVSQESVDIGGFQGGRHSPDAFASLSARTMLPSSPAPTLTTPLTHLLSITHPILLAGMAHTSTTPLASAVSLSGGLGVIGGLGYHPRQLRSMMRSLKSTFPRPLPFGIDLALPSLAPTARKTNHDYTHGKLHELIDVIVDEGAALFVSAVGVPDADVIQRLHNGGVLVMNMVGHPRHAVKAFDAGVDMVCAQGGEGGGHTGDISGNLLVPACVDVARRYHPPALRGQAGMVVAAGGIFDGRGLAAALMMGAVGVWVGTRFVASVEAGCSEMHKRAVVEAGWGDTVRTTVVTGRPLRARRNEYLEGWEKEERRGELKGLLERGLRPMERDLDEGREDVDFPFLMGEVAAMIEDVKPAREIVEGMIREAVECLERGQGYLEVDRGGSKL